MTTAIKIDGNFVYPIDFESILTYTYCKNQTRIKSNHDFIGNDPISPLDQTCLPHGEEVTAVKGSRSGLLCLTLVLLVYWLTPSLNYAYTPKEIYQKAGPGVVFIFASKSSSKGSGGTGSIITKDGLIITNAHLFSQKNSDELLSDISVFLKPNRVTGNHKADLAKGYRGKVVAYDLPLDLALVKIVNPDKFLTTVAFADSEVVDIGDQVYAIGHPEQGGLWSLTTGVISARWRDYGGVAGKHLFQTDASINRGNSGGPLLDEQGLMIGINSMIARKAADGLTITDVNFSIRSNVAIEWLNKNGYRISAVEPVKTEPQIPPEAVTDALEEKPKTKKQKEIVTTEPEPIEEDQEKIASVPTVPQKKKTVVTQQQTEKKKESTSSTPKQKKQPEKKEISQAPKQGKILTQKKPYHMENLLEDMREMEDLMDEMKDMIDDFKERRKK